MPCPTCSHTMEAFAGGGPEDELTRFLCPRCGTVKVTEPDVPDEIYVPKLVERCRLFGDTLASCHPTAIAMSLLGGAWEALGIAESIRPQEDR